MAESFEVAGHLVRRLTTGDGLAIAEIFDECAAFFHAVHGDVAHEVAHFFDDVPAGKTPEDKVAFGVWRSERIIGLLELLRGYPGPDDWYLGLLLVSPEHRRQGLGETIVTAAIRSVHESGGRTLHLGVHEQNPDALRFWLRLGFVRRDTVAQGTNQVHRLTRRL